MSEAPETIPPGEDQPEIPVSEAPEMSPPGEDPIDIPVVVPVVPTAEAVAQVEAEVDAAFDEIDTDAPLVGIVMASSEDRDKMQPAAMELEQRGILHEVRVMSAHGDPELVAEYARNAQMRGLRVIIAGGTLSAALPGIVAAHTQLPVIGVPLSSPRAIAGGLDALLAIAQMPPGFPVACVGVDAAHNAAVLAASILRT